MQKINILSIQRTSPAERARIEAMDPSIKLIDAGGWFDGEVRETWTDYAAARYLIRAPPDREHGRSATGCSAKPRWF